ncbi:MAG: helix-turn-helix domain-containing protein [Chloroflexi bacterium]|nr:helix-turn-helix domain-containing protein [Chloroflexota bacterium]
MPEEWLTLSDVAQLLGIHPSTVRVWSDHGALPVHRTQGGHRRYKRSELDLWQQSQRTDGAGDVRLMVQNALKNTRFHVTEGHLSAEAWYAKLDDEAREQYRRSGRALLQGLGEYLASDGKMAQAEAQALGYEYASRGRRFGLSAADAVHAYLFFRTVLIESMLAAFEAAAVQSPFAWSAMFRKMTSFTDQILVTILETYEAYERGANR